MSNFYVHSCFVIFILPALLCGRAEAQQYTLEYQAAPIDNPLKGLVPYARPYPNRFPHSLEFSYVSFSDLVIGPDRYDWSVLEKLLEDIGSRGNQTVFRVYLEYPDKKSGIPQFLIEDGLKIHRWHNTELAFQNEKGLVQTPDYENPKLRKVLQQFIAALGKKYDGDPRIGYITAGLLGLWGEWHNYPKGDDLWASKQTQLEVLEAYEKAFKKTPILLRYPAGEDHYDQAANHERAFGYHDDSFAHATLETGKEEDSWFFQSLMAEAGTIEKWKTQPIGGEIRPEVWGCCFDNDPCTAASQSFAKCRDQTHVTWLMDTGLFRKPAGAERLGNAKREVRKMGYEFFLKSVQVKRTGQEARLILEVENTGIAPFYHPGWTIKVHKFGAKLLVWADTNLELTHILPGEVKRLECDVPEGLGDTFLIGVPNPMEGGKPLRFANKQQDKDQAGWLRIGR